jgi:hypothetical protein
MDHLLEEDLLNCCYEVVRTTRDSRRQLTANRSADQHMHSNKPVLWFQQMYIMDPLIVEDLLKCCFGLFITMRDSWQLIDQLINTCTAINRFFSFSRYIYNGPLDGGGTFELLLRTG